MKIIVTGGLSEIFVDKIKNLLVMEKNLTLNGLNLIDQIL